MLPKILSFLGLISLLLPVVAGGADADAIAVFKVPEPSPRAPLGYKHSSTRRDRSKRCVVPTPRSSKPDSASGILAAAKRCNNGGTIIFPSKKTYIIGTKLDLTFLRHVDVAILGTIKFSTNTEYWEKEAYPYAYQNLSAFWKFGGKDVNIYGSGKGTIDGQGAVWYRKYEKDVMVQRPTLFVVDSLRGGSVSGLNLQYSPKWYNFVVNSSDVIFDKIKIRGETNYTGTNPTVNLDGWDTYRSTRIVIQNADVENDDDCVSFKPNSTNIVVQNMVCNGSHGMSVGSLGQYPGVYDIVENVTVYNTVMSNAAYAARIKVWPGVDSVWTPDLTGGGGYGRVRNVTFDGYHNLGNNEAITVTQCFGQANMTLCNMFPSNLTIHDINFENISGYTSGVNKDKLGSVVCSSPKVCGGIRTNNVTVTTKEGKKGYYSCSNVDEKELGLECGPDVPT